MATAKQLILDISRIESELTSLKSSLKRIQSVCTHEFGKVTYEPIIQNGYRMPGDAPGTMGIDWRGPVDVPRQETKQWKRVCTKCERVETTQRTKQQLCKGRIEGTASHEEVPDFS